MILINARKLPVCIRILALIVAMLPVYCQAAIQVPQQADSSRFLKAIIEFADNVLKHGADTYGNIHSPLLVDGINVRSGEPAKWQHANGEWILSNFASQQNLIRLLDGLSTITGNPKYVNAAAAATDYMFTHHSDVSGLLHWGGHQFVDLHTMEHQFTGRPHELKTNFPYYEFMWRTNPAATRKMLRAIWNAHILNWGNLDLNRHGEYNLPMGALWEHEFQHPEPFFEGQGLTFINAGTDMIQAALTLFLLDGDNGAKTWGMRLFNQYIQARHPDIGLGAYQYSKPQRFEAPPDTGALTGELTFSRYGDRAENQFGAVYGEIALEGNMLWGGRMNTLYGKHPIMMFYLAEQLEEKEEAGYLIEQTLAGMKAYAALAYVPDSNYFKPMWTDGTDLSTHVFPRTGYYGAKGHLFEVYKPAGETILAYTRALVFSEFDPILWNVVRHMFLNEGLGDIGRTHTERPVLNLNTENAHPEILMSVLEMYKLAGSKEYLQLAEQMGDNILKKKFHFGYFMPGENYTYAKFDAHEPLALLHLVAAKASLNVTLPAYLAGSGGTDGEPDIGGRPTDEWLYRQKDE